MTEPIRVLFVCSANLCRSVTAAEYATRAAQRSSSGLTWQFDSAGTHVSSDQGLPPEVARAMESLGIPIDRRPVLVSEEQARSADVILTAERFHRGVLAQRFPFTVRSVFTLLQFTRLLEAGAGPDLARLVHGGDDLLRLTRIGRSAIAPAEDESIDIGDPVAVRTEAAMLRCAEIVEAAVDRFVT
jgi:protein-tyrosine phosphatase